MCLQGLNLSPTQELVSHHDWALLQPAMNVVGVCSPRKRKHKHSGMIDCPQLKWFHHHNGVRMVYEVIAEHAQLFELHFCDLRFAPVTKHLLVGASAFFSLLVSLIFFFSNFLRTSCLTRIMAEWLSWCACSAQPVMTVSKNQHGGEQGLGMGDNLFIASNHITIQISCSEKLINSSGMTPEQRSQIPLAVWSSSLSEGYVRREKRWGEWKVCCKKSRWNVPDHSEKYKCWRQKQKVLAHFLWNESSLILLMLS